jgi:putative solute:sodium symporter small subunit
MLTGAIKRGVEKMADQNAARKERHWAKTRNLTYIVLIIWAIFAFVLPWNAGSLDSFSFLGFPLGYYIVVQGSLIVFVLLIVVQNFRQDAIDDEYDSSSKL